LRHLYLYLHTHWDREWYSPYERFRADLILLVRQVLDQLESGELPNFYLDGQSILLEDVLEIAPELAPRLKAAITGGGLLAGPWYVLADQMLVSGESLLRNLQLGLESAKRLGAAALIGYCPDSFGHSQDLPRLLAGFGINWAVVWRGVPALAEGPVFSWASPDGSSVLTYHLSQGYFQTAFHVNGPAAQLAGALSRWLVQPAPGSADPCFKPLGASLYPVGGDHLGPPLQFQKQLELLRRHLNAGEQSPVGVEAVPLGEFLRLIEGGIESGAWQPPAFCGELRSNQAARAHANAYLLPGVLSARLYLKAENRLSEHRLSAIIEPVCALIKMQGRAGYPGQELEHAWKLLLQNQPHDSICGCSVDQVHDEMQTRTRRLHNLLDALERRAREQMAPEQAATTSAAESGEQLSTRDPEFEDNRLVIFNLSGHPLSGPVRLDFVSAADRKWRSGQAGSLRAGDFQVLGAVEREELFAGLNLIPYYKRVKLVDSWAFAESVPGLGMVELNWQAEPGQSSRFEPVRVSERTVSNGLLGLEIEGDGTLAVVLGAAGGAAQRFVLGHRFRDVGDAGDSYNFDPLPSDPPLVASWSSLRQGQGGPLVGSLILDYELDIPEKVMERGQRSSGQLSERSQRRRRHRLKTEISLRRGVPIVFFETSWQNRASGHRLEVLLETGAPVLSTFSENHFSLVCRQHPGDQSALPVQNGCEQLPDRFPCQRFFLANGQLFLNCGLPEYGVEGSAVTLTILRAVPYLSRGRLRSRGGGAGPHLPTPGADCPGVNRASYGWAPLTAEPGDALLLSGQGKSPREPALTAQQLIESYQLAEQFEGRLWACLARRSRAPLSQSLIALDNPAVRVTAFCAGNGPDQLFLRLLNVTMDDQDLALSFEADLAGVERCSLAGATFCELTMEPSTSRPAAVKSRVSIRFGPNELITLRLLLKG